MNRAAFPMGQSEEAPFMSTGGLTPDPPPCPEFADPGKNAVCSTGQSHKSWETKMLLSGLPGGPVVKNPPSSAGGVGLIPG